MGEQLVGHQDRLGVLEVGASRHNGLPCRCGLAGERIDHVQDEPGDVAGLVTQVHADEGGDLVVAAAPRAQAPAQVLPGALHEAPLQGGVDVLVGGHGCEGAGDDVVLQAVQGLEHVLQLGVVQQPGTVQGPGVGP